MDKTLKSEAHSDNAELARDAVQGILKAKKILKMYPPNNPIYIKTADEIYNKFKNFLELNNELSLKISQNEILFNDKEVYYNPEKEDNMALFFFKDGIREITFLRGFSQNEFKDFIGILNADFESTAVEDDLVTLLWERDFEHIKYIATEEFLSDEDYQESRVYVKAEDKAYSDDNFAKAYSDGLKEPIRRASAPVFLSEDDFKYITKQIEEKGIYAQIEKIITLVFELIYQTKDDVIFSEVAGFIENIINYCIKNGDFQKVCFILDSIKSFAEDGSLEMRNIEILKGAYNIINNELFIQEVGKTLESDLIIEENEFTAFAKHLDKTSIPHLIHMLGELQRIRSRRFVINALTVVGKFDVKTLAEGLHSDKWYVVRNIIVVLGKIADSWSLEYLTKTLTHPDPRVRKEVIKTLAGIGGANVLRHFKNALNDDIMSVRITAAREMGNIKTEAAKNILLTELAKKDFLLKDFTEKKEFYEAVAHWDDPQVRDFLRTALKKRKFWKRIKNDETRACAAYALGIIGDKESVPYMEKAKHSKNKLLNALASAAIRRLTN